MRRLLADPFALGSEIPAWEAPTVPPESSLLRAARQELDRGLQPADGKHMRWCINKLAVLPTRDGSTVTAAFYADNFIDVCGQYPDDLWSAGTLELLQTKTFRPSPAEMVEAVGRLFAERRRMLQRVGLMLDGPTAKSAGAFVQTETRLERLQNSIASYRRFGRDADADRVQRILDRELNPSKPEPQQAVPTERPPFKPEDTPSSRRCAELAAAFHAGEPAPESRDIPEVDHG